jgi:hypothetical protein
MRGNEMSDIFIVKSDILGIETWKDVWVNGLRFNGFELRSCHFN